MQKNVRISVEHIKATFGGFTNFLYSINLLRLYKFDPEYISMSSDNVLYTIPIISTTSRKAVDGLFMFPDLSGIGVSVQEPVQSFSNTL